MAERRTDWTAVKAGLRALAEERRQLHRAWRSLSGPQARALLTAEGRLRRIECRANTARSLERLGLANRYPMRLSSKGRQMHDYWLRRVRVGPNAWCDCCDRLAMFDHPVDHAPGCPGEAVPHG